MRLNKYLNEEYLIERYIVKVLCDPKDMDLLSKVFREIYYNDANQWLLNFGISDGIYVFSKTGKVQGYIKFTIIEDGMNDTLNMSIDIKKSARNKKGLLLVLVKELIKNLKNIKGLKKLKSEFATKEGKKAGELISKKLGLELLKHDYGY